MEEPDIGVPFDLWMELAERTSRSVYLGCTGVPGLAFASGLDFTEKALSLLGPELTQPCSSCSGSALQRYLLAWRTSSNKVSATTLASSRRSGPKWRNPCTVLILTSN